MYNCMNMSGLSLNIPRLTDPLILNNGIIISNIHTNLLIETPSLLVVWNIFPTVVLKSGCILHICLGAEKKIPREISLKVVPFILNELLKQ